MEQGSNSITSGGKLRLFFFFALIAWCIYLALGYTYEFSGISGHSNFVDTSEIKDLYIDGSDVTWAVILMGHTANAMILFAMLILFAGVSIVTLIFSLLPTLLMTFIGLRKGCCVSPCEYTASVRIYYISIILSVITGLVMTKITAIIPLIILTAIWAVTMQIYLSKLKRTALQELSGQPQQQIPQ